MAELSKNYNKIISELEKKITNKQELDFVKSKISELTLLFMDTIDRLVESNEKQTKMEQKIQSIQKSLKRIEEDIYISEEDEEDDDDDAFEDEICLGDQMHDNEQDYEFEIVCPYCNYEFITGEETNQKDEIECPNCHNIIELDWDDYCDGECNHCKEHCYNENEKNEEMKINQPKSNDYEYTDSEDKRNSGKKKATKNKNEKNEKRSPEQNNLENENEDDM